MTSAEVTSAVPWDVYPYWSMKDQGDLPTKGHYDGAIAIVDGKSYTTGSATIRSVKNKESKKSIISTLTFNIEIKVTV